MAKIVLNKHNFPGLVAALIFFIAFYTFCGCWAFATEDKDEPEDAPLVNSLNDLFSLFFVLLTIVLSLVFLAALFFAFFIPIDPIW